MARRMGLSRLSHLTNVTSIYYQGALPEIIQAACSVLFLRKECEHVVNVQDYPYQSGHKISSIFCGILKVTMRRNKIGPDKIQFSLWIVAEIEEEGGDKFFPNFYSIILLKLFQHAQLLILSYLSHQSTILKYYCINAIHFELRYIVLLLSLL